MQTLHSLLVLTVMMPGVFLVACGRDSAATTDTAPTGTATTVGSAPDDGTSAGDSTGASSADASAPKKDGSANDGGGDGGAAVDAGPRPPSVVPLCVHARNAMKALLDRCCMKDDPLIAEVDHNCDELYGPSYAAGWLVADAAGETQCFAALDDAANNTSCTTFKDGTLLPYMSGITNLSDNLARVFTPCDSVMKGAVSAPGACLLDADCVDGLTCIGAAPFDDQVKYGKCQPPQALGGLCGQGTTKAQYPFRVHTPLGNHPECAQGYCSGNQCTAAGAMGDNCFDDAECAAGLTCLDSKCGTGTLPALGESCTTRCADDYAFCYRPGNAPAGVCTKGRTVGESCERNGDCDGSCSVPAGKTLGTCVSICGSN